MSERGKHMAADEAREVALACDQMSWARRDGGLELSLASSALNKAADVIDELLEVLKQAREKLQIECGGSKVYLGGVPTQILFPRIDAAISAATGASDA